MNNLSELRDKIKSVVPIGVVVGTNNTRIHCPLHGSKDMDLQIHHGDNTFRCWGSMCRKSGDVVSWYMFERNLTVYDAIKAICAEFGISQQVPDQRVDILTRAATYYQDRLLNSDEGAEALQYLLDRKISEETIRIQKIGLADRLPTSITEQEAREVGIINRIVSREAGKSDFDSQPLTHRIVFPLFDWRNRIVHMQGRLYMDDANKPKYMGLSKLPTDASDRTPYPIPNFLYNENVLYRTNSSEAFLVEGIPDCLTGIQWYLPIVCLLGNQSLHKHAHKFKRVKVLNVCMDSDEQTRNVILKELSAVQQKCPQLVINDIILPTAKDLNQFAKQGGTKSEFLDICKDNCKPYIERIMDEWSSRPEMHQPLLYTVAARHDYANYVPYLAKRLGTTEEAIRFTIKVVRRTEEHAN